MEKILLWYQKKRRSEKMCIYFLVFTIFFIFTWIFANTLLIFNGKSFINRDDSIAIYYEMLSYRKQILNEFIVNLFQNHQFAIPWNNYNLTGDSNIFCILGHEIFDIFLWFMPEKWFETAYCIVISARVWCAGIAFSLYCFKMGNRKCYTLMGSLVYSFSSYAMVVSCSQPFFLSMLYIMPIMLIGVENIFRNNKRVLFIGSVAVSSLVSVYLAYYNTIVLGLYCIVRFFPERRKIKLNIKLYLSLIFNYFLGFGVAGFLVIPTIIGIISSDRVNTNTSEYQVFYGISYALNFVKDFFVGKSGTNYCHLGFSVIALFPLLYLLLSNKYIKLKIGFLLIIVFMNSQIFGFIAGAGNVNNRWSYCLGFVVAYTVVIIMPSILDKITQKKMTILNVIAVLYSLIVLLCSIKYDEKRMLITCAFLITIIVCINIIWRTNLLKKSMAFMVLLGIEIASIIGNGFSLQNDKYIKAFIDEGTANDELAAYVDAASQDIEDSTFYRIEKYRFEDELSCNLPYWYGYNGISNTANLLNSYAISYYRELENPGIIQINKSSDLDGRVTDEALASVKYYLANKEFERMIPYGFKYLKDYSGNDQYAIYVNEFALPLGYTYEKAMEKATFDKLNIAEKQDNMLQAIVLNDSAIEDNNKIIDEGNIRRYEAAHMRIIQTNNAEKTSEGWQIEGKDAYIILEIDSCDNSEIYIRLDEVQNMGNTCGIDVSSENGINSVNCHGKTTPRQPGQSSLSLNIGEGKTGKMQIKIFFSKSANISIKNIEVYIRQLSFYEEDIENLKQEELENVVFDTNKIEGDITVTRDKFLCLSIPYSKGWVCYVDDQRVEVEQANIMYMAIALQQGSHHIKLLYTPPGMKAGIVISLICVIGIILWNICNKQRSKQKVY